MLAPVKTGVHVPDRYNGDLLDGYGLNMDFLILNLEGNPLTESIDGLTIELAEYGTKVYEHRANLTYDGEKFGTIVFKPRSSVVPKNLVQMQLENHLYYTTDGNELKEMVKTVVEMLGLTYQGVNRIDVALDYMREQVEMQQLFQGIFEGKFLIKGRQKDVNYYTTTQKGKTILNGVQVGKRGTSRFCRIYNKSVEMQKGDLKPYIADYWKNLGLNGTIWRFEYQLSNKFMRELENVSLDTLFSKNFLFNLFQKARENHFELKHNTGKSEVNKEKDYNIIDFAKVKKFLGMIGGVIGKLKRTIKETFIGQQRMIKGLLRSYFSSGHDIRFLLPVRGILDTFDLWEWYNMKVPQYIHEFREREKIKIIDLKQYEQDFKLYA